MSLYHHKFLIICINDTFQLVGIFYFESIFKSISPKCSTKKTKNSSNNHLRYEFKKLQCTWMWTGSCIVNAGDLTPAGLFQFDLLYSNVLWSMCEWDRIISNHVDVHNVPCIHIVVINLQRRHIYPTLSLPNLNPVCCTNLGENRFSPSNIVSLNFFRLPCEVTLI